MIEANCDTCGRVYSPWSADNDLWNEVMPDDGGLLCPSCFMDRFDDESLVFRVAVSVRGGRAIPQESP